MLELNNVSKKYKDKVVLNNINVVFKENNFNIIVGESGSGKSTLLNIASSLLANYEGEVLIDKNDKLLYNLVDDMNINILSVLDNLRLVTNNEEKIDLYLDKLGITYTKNKKVSLLSKGEQARVSIARTLLSNSNIILLDEPTGNLDQKTSKIIFELLKKESSNKTIILVTHDLEYAKKYATRLYELNNSKLKLINESVNEVEENKSKVDLEPDFKIHKRLLLKYAFKKLFQKKVLLVLNSLLIIVAVLQLFLGISFKNINAEKTSNNWMDSMPNSIYKIKNDNQNKEMTNNFINGREIYSEVTLKSDISFSGEKQTVSAVFYSDVASVLNLDNDLDDYPIPSEYVNTEDLTYFPVIISSEFRNRFIEDFDTVYNKGDLLPFSYFYLANRQTEKFVIVDIIDGNYDSPYISGMYPIIVSKNSYYKTIDDYGIPNNEFVKDLDKKYDELISNFDSDDYRHQNSGIYSGNLVSIDCFSNIKSYSEMGDTEEGVCFVGKIPTKDNEIMIGNSYEYYLMNGIYDKSSISSDIEDTKEKSSEFLEKYKDGLDITMGDFSSYSYDISNIKIVGAYAYKKNGQLYNLVNNDYIIINSSLMDKMLEDIYNNGLIINNLGSYYYSKNELKKSFKRILNNDLYINVDNFDDYKSAMNMDSFSNSMIGISLFIFVISTLTILFIYITHIRAFQKIYL